MSLRKPLAGAAAVAAALALAVPAASANAATSAPAVRTVPTLFGAGSLYCDVLVSQLRFAALTGNVPAENFLGEVLVYSTCGGAAI
jgi:hypothetical protein